MTQTVDSPGTSISPPPAAAIATSSVSKSFRDVHAVRDVSMTIERGEVVALLGPNGAGKTTLMDLMLGFTTPNAGCIQILGTSPEKAVAEGRVGAVLQSGALLPDLTVKETIKMVAACHHSPIPTDAALTRAGITHLAGRKVGKCSGGEQQRLRFALAMLTEPELLFLDEPTAGMDVRARREFWHAIHEEAERGRTVVFATHYLQEATDFADRIILLRAGRIEAEGTVADLTQDRARVLTCSWTSPTDPADFARVHDVKISAIYPDRVEFSAVNTDDLARDILANNLAHSLDIRSASLDSVFMDLTEGNESE